jgi:hypothetical protein
LFPPKAPQILVLYGVSPDFFTKSAVRWLLFLLEETPRSALKTPGLRGSEAFGPLSAPPQRQQSQQN